MLVDVKFKDLNEDYILRVCELNCIDALDNPTRVESGIYITNDINSEYKIDPAINPCIRMTFNYGVSDNIAQIKDYLQREGITDTEDAYVVFVTPIIKEEQPEHSGWRWHKWGEYIGTKTPKHEYIYDEEDDIPFVLVFCVYQLFYTKPGNITGLIYLD